MLNKIRNFANTKGCKKSHFRSFLSGKDKRLSPAYFTGRYMLNFKVIDPRLENDSKQNHDDHMMH